MSDAFFDHPILNSPYELPLRHWELDESGQPTQKIIENRRRADFITPIPKPKKRKSGAVQQVLLGDDSGISTQAQPYDPTAILAQVRTLVEEWRSLPNPNQWQVSSVIPSGPYLERISERERNSTGAPRASPSAPPKRQRFMRVVRSDIAVHNAQITHFSFPSESGRATRTSP